MRILKRRTQIACCFHESFWFFSSFCCKDILISLIVRVECTAKFDQTNTIKSNTIWIFTVVCNVSGCRWLSIPIFFGACDSREFIKCWFWSNINLINELQFTSDPNEKQQQKKHIKNYLHISQTKLYSLFIHMHFAEITSIASKKRKSS